MTGVTASANAWDTRVSGNGCPPSGCLPGNVLDGSTSPASRWSCSASLLSSSEVCELTLGFETPQEISQISMALHMGDERVRTFNVLVDGVLATTITSSGTTLDFEPYELIVSGATTVVLQAGMPANSWFSITEVNERCRGSDFCSSWHKHAWNSFLNIGETQSNITFINCRPCCHNVSCLGGVFR